jgi:hypothetical protein
VVFDGHYGKPGHRRQRYRCYPSGVGGNGQPFHRFAPELPREAAPSGECDHCERPLAAHEGPQTPRRHRFAARDIAHALIEVGSGTTYQSASWRVRRRADRFPMNGDGEERRSAHGQLVADWVEKFAPVVFEEHRLDAWPTSSLVLDNLPFRLKVLNADGFPMPAGPVAFQIFAAYGYQSGRPRIWRLEAFPSATAPEWRRFLNSLDGAPSRVVADAHSGISAAVKAVWPEADFYYSEWHLQEKMRLRLTRAKMNNPRERVWRRLDLAFSNLYFWEHFLVSAERERKRCPELWTWIDRWGSIIETQLARRPRDDERPRDWPRTTAGLERKLERVKDWIEPRSEAFRNRERLNRLLMLMQLELNGDADEIAYTHAIREWLLARNGDPGRRRLIADGDRYGSLRAPRKT